MDHAVTKATHRWSWGSPLLPPPPFLLSHLPFNNTEYRTKVFPFLSPVYSLRSSRADKLRKPSLQSRQSKFRFEIGCLNTLTISTPILQGWQFVVCKPDFRNFHDSTLFRLFLFCFVVVYHLLSNFFPPLFSIVTNFPSPTSPRSNAKIGRKSPWS